MAKSDPALKWLLENDPAARSTTQNGYLRDAGIIGATRAGEIAERETTLVDVPEPVHCAQCAAKSHGAWHTTR